MALGYKSTPASQAPEVQEIILRPPRFGLTLFHNPSTPTSGVACVAPRATHVFNRRNELASDVLWISNASDGAQAQNFRDLSYLRSTPTQIAADLGVSLNDTVDGLPVVAETVGRVRDMAAQAYPWNDFSTDWSHKSLPISIAKILPSTGEILSSMESALRQAHQTYSSVPDRPYLDGNAQTIYTLRVNRMRYAQYICSTTLPSNAWIAVPNVSSHDLSMDDFLDPTRPSLVEVSIEFSTGLNEAVTPALTAFGSDKVMGRTPLRKWVSQPELAWLVEHANVHIQSAFISQGCEKLGPGHALPAQLMADPVQALCISTGLVAECHWVGLSSKVSVRRAANSATAKFVDLVSPAAVWLRAADRAYCFAMAKIVAARGLQVTGYGYGAVSFFGPRGNVPMVMELADELGTCHPCLMAVQKRSLIGQEGHNEGSV